MRICKSRTEHDTITETVLCDAGNVAVACEDKLLAMRDDSALSTETRAMAVNNLRSRFGYDRWDQR